MENLKFPIGKANLKSEYSFEEIKVAVAKIAAFPQKIEEQVAKMSVEQLSQPYRPGGWTGIQVVHHLADSHMHAYTRTKFALITDQTPILGYEESEWALTPEIEAVDIRVSIQLLKALHARWTGLFSAMKEKDFENSYLHSEGNRLWNLGKVANLYAWHGEHHLGHLKILAKK